MAIISSVNRVVPGTYCVIAPPHVTHGVEVVTDDEVFSAARAVVTADAWTAGLVEPLGVRLPLTVTEEQVTYFTPADPEPFRPGRFPVWIWMDDPSFYGFPLFGDLHAVKGAEDCGGRETDPDTRTFEPDVPMEERLRSFLEGHPFDIHGPFGVSYNPLLGKWVRSADADVNYLMTVTRG